MTRKALGRGLSALLREVETTPVSGLEKVPVDLIDPNPYQPRRTFSNESLQELADSIRASGVVQPVLLRRAKLVPDAAGGSEVRYQLVAGERRWRAAKLAGLDAVPAIVQDLSDRDALELALTENLLREDLNPLEVARAYNALQEKFALGHEEIAARLGVNRTTVTNTLRLLRLPPEIQDMIAAGELTAGHARALVTLDSPQAQLRIAKLVAEKGLSVRQVESMVAPRQGKAGDAKKGEAPRLDPNIRAAVLELERVLGTRVRLVGTERRGRIEIRYFSAEDLNRIYEWIVRR
ncbi:MAG TPA: ParB/RepB/Spo0J family partition protein [Terriglobia bacterium]|nr:ParB/RepB/Spo0J family partition protein [Terriglobia bacterium]